MKFEIKDLYYGGIVLYEKTDSFNLIRLGDIYLYKQNNKDFSNCFQNELSFDYHGIENALCGKTGIAPNNIKPKRILVIQMK